MANHTTQCITFNFNSEHSRFFLDPRQTKSVTFASVAIFGLFINAQTQVKNLMPLSIPNEAVSFLLGFAIANSITKLWFSFVYCFTSFRSLPGLRSLKSVSSTFAVSFCLDWRREMNLNRYLYNIKKCSMHVLVVCSHISHNFNEWDVRRFECISFIFCSFWFGWTDITVNTVNSRCECVYKYNT